MQAGLPVFENLMGQEALVTQLKADLVKDQLSPSMLFCGLSYSGKLTVALELARVLSCEKQEKAEWQCDCPSCYMARRLLHPYTVMLGNRYFYKEIEACSATYLNDTQSMAGRFLYLRAVRKLIRRFDNFLWEDDDNRYKKVKNSVAPLEELLEVLEPLALETPQKPLTAKQQEKLVADINKKAFDLATILEGYAVSIGQIRQVNRWARSNGQSVKVVIIEEADKMAEGARNALLKILEEPSERLYFILITCQKGAIMPTILSRVRPYVFEKRTEAIEQVILNRIFKQEGSSLSLFFNKGMAVNVKELAHHFLDGKQKGLPFNLCYPSKELDDLFEEFLFELTLVVQEKLTDGQLNVHQASNFMDSFNYVKQQYSGYRQSALMLAEYLFYD